MLKKPFLVIHILLKTGTIDLNKNILKVIANCILPFLFLCFEFCIMNLYALPREMIGSQWESWLFYIMIVTMTLLYTLLKFIKLCTKNW